MITERDGAAKATAETPFSFWKLPIQPVPLFTDGALLCKIPKHLSVYSLLHTHKNVYMTDISFQAVDHERNQSYSDTRNQEHGPAPAFTGLTWNKLFLYFIQNTEKTRNIQ